MGCEGAQAAGESIAFGGLIRILVLVNTCVSEDVVRDEQFSIRVC